MFLAQPFAVIGGDARVADVVTSLAPGKPVPAQHHAIASQL
jgi:hypothetical protein